ncbi:ATP-grasp domain-containing protein [Spirillospora sp. NPDC052269]
MQDFLRRLKAAVTGSPGTPLVLLGNFEVEERWAGDVPGLPKMGFSTSSALVNRMEEFTLLLGGPDDHVLLKEASDPAYLDHLAELGIELPRILCAARHDPQRTVTQDVLDDPALVAELTDLAARGAWLLTHGTSDLEEELARRTGLPLVGPDAATCRTVNSKIYSRRVAADTGLRQAEGWVAETAGEFEAIAAEAKGLLASGRTVVAKDAFGVSGKGILVVRDEQRLDRLATMVRRRAFKHEEDRVALLLEEWVAKKADLNYQFTIARSGEVRFDFVKEALTEGGVHKGHRIPARLDETQVAELRKAAQVLGERLSADGFHGVVGVDAMVDPDGGIYPVVEINARSNMSTYQLRLQELFLGPGRVALARQYPLRLGRPLPYAALRRLLDGLLFVKGGGEGLIVNNFATVNAAGPAEGAHPVEGRLHGLLIAGDRHRLDDLDMRIAERLAEESERSTS